MNKAKLVETIERFAPPELAERWDCSGWVVETAKDEVKKALICLTPTKDTLKQAIENNCDIIISHHPMFFVPFEFSKIDIYCAHTNMDNTKGGTTDTIIKTLGFNSENHVVECNITVETLKEKLKKISPNLRYVNNNGIKELRKIGFCAGSGSDYIDEYDCDAFVTGDLKYHTAVEADKVLFDIGHFESEILIKNVFKNLLENEIEVVTANEKSPFITD